MDVDDRDLGRRRAAVALASASVGLCVLDIALLPAALGEERLVRGPRDDGWAVVMPVAYAIAGGVLARSRPRHPLGWVLVTTSLLVALSSGGGSVGALLTVHGWPVPGLLLVWIATWAWVPGVVTTLLLLPVLFPSGRPTGRLGRLQVRTLALGTVAVVLALALSPDGLDDWVLGQRTPWHVPDPVVTGLAAAGGVLLLANLPVVLVATARRAVQAGRPERPQLLLLLSAVAVVAPFTVLDAPRALDAASGALVPLAVAVGILRYDLLGLDPALRRVLVYVPLTGLVALAIGLGTTLVARLVPQGVLPLVAASAVVAVIVVPVSRSVQAAVDRLVLGPHSRPLRTVAALGGTVPGEAPLRAVVRAVAEAVGVRRVRLLDVGGDVVVVHGSAPHSAVVVVPLRHGDEDVGHLEVTCPPGERSLDRRATALLAAVAPQVAVAQHAAALTAALEAAHGRLLDATEVERDRLRRDLHDGLGPSLSGVALGLEAARTLLGSDPPRAAQILDRVHDEVGSAVEEVRRTIAGLRPAALDVGTLTDAVQARASSLNASSGLRVHVDAAAALDLPSDVEAAAWRVVDEAVTNAVRHSRGRSCRITLAQDAQQLVVEVADDGVGLPAAPRLGVGIPSMRRRIEDLGGAFEVQASGTGTVVSARLPAVSRG